jgi:glutamine cyclotransferase
MKLTNIFPTIIALLLIYFSCTRSYTPFSPTPNKNYTYRIVEEYPHRQDAFTQGLVFYDGYLYEGTGLNGYSSLRRVDIKSGEVLQIKNLPAQYFGEGITIYNDKIYQLTWQSGTGFVYDLNTFDLLDQFYYSGEGWGLTCDDTSLIMSDGTSYLYFLDPETYEKKSRIEVKDHGKPITHLNELEYINGEIFANVWLTSKIARISPDTGEVLGWLNLYGILPSRECSRPIDVLNGIAYDPATGWIYITGKFWCKLFVIELITE